MPLNLEKLRQDAAKLADLACTLDDLKNSLPHPGMRASMSRAVDEMHDAARFFDDLHGFGIYLNEAPQ